MIARKHGRAAVAGAVLTLAACATGVQREQLPFESPVIEVAPGAPYERCVHLVAGDRLYFHYRADPPMGFAIRHRTADAVLSYVVRDPSREDAGVFAVAESNDYCLRWQPVASDAPWATLLRYEMRLTQADFP
jgi:hypothetical protein